MLEFHLFASICKYGFFCQTAKHVGNYHWKSALCDLNSLTFLAGTDLLLLCIVSYVRKRSDGKWGWSRPTVGCTPEGGVCLVCASTHQVGIAELWPTPLIPRGQFDVCEDTVMRGWVASVWHVWIMRRNFSGLRRTSFFFFFFCSLYVTTQGHLRHF